ncbi:MAG: hypothetical protein ACE15B_13270 [Bryobacteraceae bacterium]
MRVIGLAVSLCMGSTLLPADTAQERLQEASAVFTEIMGAPAAVRGEGGGGGFQIGGSGAGASVAAGPVGRAAEPKTDARLSAEILS